MSKLTGYKACDKEIAKGVKKCPNCGKDQRNWFMRHKILTFIVGIILISLITNVSGNSDEEKANNTEDRVETEVVSDEESKENEEVDEVETEEVEPEEVAETEEVPREHKSALNKADIYANTMDMSKAGVYNQLTSSAGEDFPEDAAQYAIDNVEADWKENALNKAETYADTMDMSESAVYDQLISSAGEKFTEEEAQYAIDNLN